MDQLIYNFSPKSLSSFFKSQISSFVPQNEEIHDSIKDGEKKNFSNLTKHGETFLKDKNELLVFSCKSIGPLSERSSRRKQFEIAKKVLKEDFKDGAIFVFYDDSNKFRFSFIRKNWGEKGEGRYSSWNRYTYFINPSDTNKTFKERVGNCKFSTLDDIQEAFSVDKLTKDFYNDLFKWYQWTLSEEIGITFPNNTIIVEDDRVKLEEQVIRLITRILFVWFIKQKHLVPDTLFKKDDLVKVLKDFDPSSKTDGSYYNAILQNLFFATLNKAINERDFARLQNTRDVKTLYRYEEMFQISNDDVLNLFRPIPFLNGGLFECLDKEDIDGNKYYLDGFSRNDKKLKGHFKHRAFIPNCIFFDDKNGLIPLLERYNFTVEENAPNEVQVALDPELLGNVFENLLGAFNSETKETARKQSGSFYTPREVVNYMVDESLIAYTINALPNLDAEAIRKLFEVEEVPEIFANDHTICESVSKELRKVKILDPACGSGAFPMGILNKMVSVLQKLDCTEETIYDQKLHLIEECIYGVDVQTIAAQISKLRFFISLICEQGAIDLEKENYGVLTLPNLETKFVAADTLIGIGGENKNLLNLTDENLVNLKNELWEIRRQHFYAKRATEKKKLREQDEQVRGKIKNYIAEKASRPNEDLITIAEAEIKKLKENRNSFVGENWVDATDKKKQTSLFGIVDDKQPSLFKVDKNKEAREKIDLRIKSIENDIARERNKSASIGFNAEVEAIAKWNPYDQNSSSPFFDPEWMFGLTLGFDIVIGNPPYIQLQNDGGRLAKRFQDCGYKTFARAGDIYSLFYERGWQLLKENGALCFITSNSWMRAGYGENTRKFFAENTNPILLIDFAGQKIFDSATVDTNILLFTRSKNEGKTKACVVKEKVLNKLSDYLRQTSTLSNFSSEGSWVVLSEIEQRIKIKIEAVGTPLKEWDINIYRGVLTGFNEAFIIDSKRKEELIREDPKSAEIIRPILRGRDIKRYSHKFADLYLIATFPSLNIDIDHYPAVKQHLISFKYDRLKQTGDPGARKKTNNQWFETQDSINYWEDFNRQKIVWGNLNLSASYAIAEEGMFVNAPCPMIVPASRYLLAVLNSKLADFYIKTLGITRNGGYFEYKPMYIEQLPVPKADPALKLKIEFLVGEIENDRDQAKEKEINRLIFELYNISTIEAEFIDSL